MGGEAAEGQPAAAKDIVSLPPPKSARNSKAGCDSIISLFAEHIEWNKVYL